MVLVAFGAWTLWTRLPAWLLDAAASRLEERGIELRVEDMQIHGIRSVSAGRVELTRGHERLICATVRVHAAWADWRTPRWHHLASGACEWTHTGTDPTPQPPPSGEPEATGPLDRLQALLALMDAPSAWLAALQVPATGAGVRVESLRIRRGTRELHLRDVSLDLWRQTDRMIVTGRIDALPDLGVQEAAPFRLDWSEGAGLVVVTPMQVQAAGLLWRVAEVRFLADQVRLSGVEAMGQTEPRLRLDLARIDWHGEGGRARLHAEDVEVRAGDHLRSWSSSAAAAPADPPALPEVEEADGMDPTAPRQRCPQDARCASRAGEMLDALVAGARQLRQRQREAPGRQMPFEEISVGRLRVVLGERGEVLGTGLQLLDSDVLRGSFAWGGVEVELEDASLRRGEVRFGARGMSLERLGPAIGQRVESRGTLSLQGQVQLDEAGLQWQGALSIEGGGFDWPAVAPGPVDGVTVALQSTVTVSWAPPARVTVHTALDWGDVPLRWTFDLESRSNGWHGRTLLELREETLCQRIWLTIPEGMLPNLGHRGVTFEGSTGLQLTASYRFGDAWSFDLGTELFPGTCRVRRVDRAFDPEQLNRPGFLFHVTEGVTRADIHVGPGTADYVSLGSLPSYVPAAMYLTEEIGFYRGVGISLGLIRRAVSLNLDRGRYVYGGSTVMQQLVKNLFLSRAKTLSRKLEEAVLVWAMLERVDKDRILELYLNCIEFGPDVYGIARASRYYFGKPPQWLTPLEAIFLANLKPSPRDGERMLRRGHSPVRGWWQDRNRRILQRLVDYGGHIDQAEVDHYAPFVVALTGTDAWRATEWRPMERPGWALGPQTGGLPEAEEAAEALP
jgi:hypothetical protein